MLKGLGILALLASGIYLGANIPEFHHITVVVSPSGSATESRPSLIEMDRGWELACGTEKHGEPQVFGVTFVTGFTKSAVPDCKCITKRAEGRVELHCECRDGLTEI
jgi:hypothetical protein